MSCSIHMTVERRVEGRWVCVNTMLHVEDDRHGFCFPVARTQIYRRFAALAGVRGDGPEPRGIPEDICPATRYQIDQMGVDGHSHSWLPLLDAVQILLATEPRRLSDFELRYPTCYYFGLESWPFNEYRLVFWFDN